MFTPRTSPVEYGTKPYAWNISPEKIYQCVWFAYYRSLEAGFSAPCWYEGSGETGYGAYTNAKEWLKNYRSPWEVKDTNYIPVAGDIAVFDGEYGHVQFMETSTMYSEYSSGDPNSFKNGNFAKKSNLLGFLHYPYEPLNPVERNTNVDQIQTTDEALRIRTKPNGDIVGHVQLGYYNVLDKKKDDNYTWYKLAKDRWCADITTIYLPAENDALKELERIYNSMKASIDEKDALLKEREERLNEIHTLSEV